MIEREIQDIEEVTPQTLLAAVDSLRLDDWRLVQILALSSGDRYELDYSFGGGYALHTLRLDIDAKDPVPSITPFYRAAFFYENEIRDLFGVRIERIDPDWEGKVFDVDGDRPFRKVSVAGACVESPGPIRITGIAEGTP